MLGTQSAGVRNESSGAGMMPRALSGYSIVMAAANADTAPAAMTGPTMRRPATVAWTQRRTISPLAKTIEPRRARSEPPTSCRSTARSSRSVPNSSGHQATSRAIEEATYRTPK